MNITFEEITSFSQVDLTGIKNLVKQLDSGFDELQEEDYKDIIKSPASHLLVLRDQDTKQLLGMVTLIVYRIPYKVKAQLEDLVVDESMRGKGLGKQLLSFAIDKAREYHVVSLNLTSKPTREAANNLYQSLGFEKRDTNVYRITLSK